MTARVSPGSMKDGLLHMPSGSLVASTAHKFMVVKVAAVGSDLLLSNAAALTIVWDVISRWISQSDISWARVHTLDGSCMGLLVGHVTAWPIHLDPCSTMADRLGRPMTFQPEVTAAVRSRHQADQSSIPSQ